jgi:hypothetical protein
LKPICAHLIPINAPLAETARWKRRVPRRPPIYAHASKAFHAHAAFFQLSF